MFSFSDWSITILSGAYKCWILANLTRSNKIYLCDDTFTHWFWKLLIFMPPPTKWLEAFCFRVVRTSVQFCLCRYLKNREAVLHETWYEDPGGTILCVDFKVTGSKVKGHRLFCVNLVQCLAYYET